MSENSSAMKEVTAGKEYYEMAKPFLINPVQETNRKEARNPETVHRLLNLCLQQCWKSFHAAFSLYFLREKFLSPQ